MTQRSASWSSEISGPESVSVMLSRSSRYPCSRWWGSMGFRRAGGRASIPSARTDNPSFLSTDTVFARRVVPLFSGGVPGRFHLEERIDGERPRRQNIRIVGAVGETRAPRRQIADVRPHRRRVPNESQNRGPTDDDASRPDHGAESEPSGCHSRSLTQFLCRGAEISRNSRAALSFIGISRHDRRHSNDATSPDLSPVCRPLSACGRRSLWFRARPVPSTGSPFGRLSAVWPAGILSHLQEDICLCFGRLNSPILAANSSRIKPGHGLACYRALASWPVNCCRSIITTQSTAAILSIRCWTRDTIETRRGVSRSMCAFAAVPLTFPTHPGAREWTAGW